MVTELHLGDISVDVVFKDIKNVHLSVYPPTGRVRISAPDRMSLENVRLFAISKLAWIKGQQKKLQAQDREPAREYLDRESHYLWGKRYLLQIEEQGGRATIAQEHKKLILTLPENTAHEKRQEVLDSFYRSELKAVAKPLVHKWEKQLGLAVERLYVQKMKTKWGSSNPLKQAIRLNLELAKKPQECLDYVILHEILHFKVQDHGEQFQCLMDRYMPNWRTVRRALNEAPLGHSDWTY